MLVVAAVLLVIAALANIAKFIYLFSLHDGDAAKRIGLEYRLNGITFAMGVAAFVMQKHQIAIVLFAASMLLLLVMVFRKRAA
jgi:hypothetical protein